MSETFKTHSSRHTGSALFHQLYLLLREDILRGRYTAGTRLPGEKLLAEQHGVSRITVRRALDLLADEDLVHRIHGSGTYISDRAHPATLRGEIEAFSQQAAWLTRNTKVKLISVETSVPSPEVARAMSLSDGETAQRSLRLRSYLGKPCLLLDTFVPNWIASLYTEDELGSTSLQSTMRGAGITLASADYTVSAAPADARLANLLDVPIASALLYMIWAIRDKEDRLVEYQIVHARPDVYVLHTVLRAS